MEVPNFKKSRLSQLVAHGLIISGRGGSKGGGSSRTPVEANDTVNSRAMASVLDLLGEGVIGGLIDGAKSIFLNDTPLQNSDNSYNFSGVTWWFRDGSQDQSVIDGFDFIETPKSVGRQLKQTSQVNVSLDSADSDRVRVVMKFPSLRSIDKKSGDTNGTTVQFKFQIDAGNGGGFVDVVAEGESNATISLTAKKTGVYYRSYVLDLPKPAKAYTLRAIRLTEDHTDNSYLYDDTYIDSIGEIVNTSLNYPNSALVGLKINSEQFGSSMPTRSYLIKGLKIRVPSNYNADTNSYDGNWDGTFKLASSSNPAWILFDLLTNTRYGLGQFVQESMINIGELYQIGRYCDAFVDDGFGGKEKRFAINTQITSRQDAYRVVQDIAGAFRGMVYWAGGMVHITQDSPADPVMLFSNSNVVNGSFAYKGSARKDRYSVALITYNNKEDGYKQSVEYVEDQEAIKRYGIRKTESVAFGCTSRGQAHRVGLWTLYTSRMESDVITFAVGMDSVFLMPGDIVLIADKFRAGRRNSGRIIGYTSNSIKLDAPVDLTSVGNHITFLSAEGKMVGRDILENGKNITTVTFKTALSSNETPVSDAVWVIAQPDLTPLQARVVSVAEGDDGTSFNITAIQNNPTKYEAIDSGAQLIPQNTTVLDPTFSKPSGLAITEGTYLSSPGNLSVSLTATWQGKSAQYYISWRRSDAGNVSNWKSERVTEEQFELRGVAENGQYDFQVYAVSVGGRKTDPISITYKVLGTMTAPDAPTGLTAVGDYRSIVLNWVNPASVDLDHIEVLASKTNDKSKAQLIAKVSGTTFSHNGLEDSVTWYYWVRAANKRVMLSALNSPLATVATTRDVLSFLQNKITESELGQDLITDINSKAVATEVDAAIDDAKSQATNQVNSARAEAANAVSQAQKTLDSLIKQEVTDRKSAVADEAKQRAKAIADEADARTKAISDEATARADAISKEVTARDKAIADEATARAKAVADEASARASAISDSIAVEANARAKAISDSASTLSAKIDKEASDRAAAVSALDTKTANALSSETSSRIAAISDEAKTRADAILQEQNSRKADISTLKTQVQTSTDSLAQQISQVAAGTGEQFDSLNIWYFDTSNEGWTEDDSGNTPMSVTSDGWLRSASSTASYRSPNYMAIDAAAYRFVKLRLKKVGSPVWAGKLFWIGTSEGGWSDARSLTINEPEYDANGVATLTIHDIDWRSSETIRRFRFDFLKNQDSTNYVQIDWIAVGRPTPGAGMAALQAEQTARANADAAEAANRNTLAVQIRGSYDGNDLSKVSSGLIFQEQQARVTADKAEATARQSLETKVNDSVSSINKSLDTLNTQDKAMASDISGLKSSLGNKADASALQTLKTTVDQQGSGISTQGQSITKLQNDLNTTNTNVGKKADQTALVSLQGTVTQQGKDITSANSSITNLKTSLDATNSNLAKKADASAVGDLSSRVSATEDKVSSQGDSIVQLNNSLNNALADSDASSKTPNNLIVNPSFERGTDGYIGVSSLSTVVAIQIPHVGTKALKIDPGSSVSPGQYIDFVKGRTYEIGVWAKQVSGTADNGQGNNKLRVGNSAGAPVFEVPFANLTVDWTKVSKRWKATETGSLPVTLSNYLTAGNRYFDDFYVIDVTDSVAIDANASALSSLQNTVTQQGKDISSQSTSITDLNNSLKTTNDNVAKKADASALQSLQNTVTQQGKDLTSVGNRATALENSIKTTNDNVATKADASALSTLQNTVSQHGDSIASQSDSITSLKNSVGSLVNMGDNLVQDSSFDNGGQTFRTQQNSGTSGSIVAFGAFGENSAGVRMVKVNSTSPGLFANGKLPVPVNGARKYRYIVRAKGVSGAMNMLLRRWNFNGNTEGAYEDKNNTLTTDWQTITWDTSFSPKDGVNGQSFGIYCHPANAEIWIDSFQVFDITDAFNNDTTASALSNLSTTVSQQGSTVTSQGAAITKLQNDLSSTKTDVSKKADSTALQTLQNTVTDQGKTLTSQGNAITALTGTVDTVKGDVAKKADATALNNLSTRVSNAEDKISSSSDAITSLNSSLNQQSKRGANILPDGTFESYSSGYNITNGRVIVTTDDSHGGNKCIRVTRPNDYNANATDNSDNHIFSGFQVRDNAVFYVECWVKLDAKSTTMDGSVQIAVGMSLQYQDNSWQWPALIKSAKDLSADTWTKVSGYLKSSKSGIKQAMVRISMPNVSTVKAGNSFLVDDFVITDVTDAYNAQQTADATASAVSTLQTTVSKQGDSITSQGDSITTLNNGLATANKAIGTKADASALQTLQNAVNQQGKDVASNTSNITALSNQIVNGKQGTWSRRIYKCQLSSAAAEPTFSDIQGLSPVFMDEVADAAKLDFSGAGSYVVAHYKAMVRVAADTTISVSPGSRVFDDSGAVYVNGVRQAVAISGTATLGFVLSSGWNTVEFLVNQWTGNAYINLGFKLGDKVAELYSGLGVSSLSTAINSINSNVNKVGDQTSSNSAAITSLKNSLSDTDSAVAKKADASALQTLQNTVTQQGKDIASQSDSVTNLSNALSNVSIGGVNLIKNSGDMAGWSGKTNEIFRGNAVISATTKAGSSYRDLKEITLDAPVDNAEYVYSFFAKGGENGQSMTAYFYNPNSTTSGVSSQGVSDGSVDGRMSFTLTTEWVRYWVKWKQKPGTGSKRIILARIQASSTKDQTVSITSPKLEVGNMPTEWSPAPSDMASSNDLSSLKTTVDANSSSIQSVTSRVQKTEDNISTQNTAITKLQGDLSTTNNLVSTKADSAALQTLQNSVTQQGKDISSQGTRVTSIENSLTSGANLIPNAKMLNGAQGWGGAATTVDGYAAVNSSAGWQPVSPLFEVTPGDTLDLSMMCLAGQAITVGWGLRFDGPSLSNATIYASNLSYQAGEKKAVSGTFVVPVGATTARLQPNTGATASLTVYNVVVTRRDAGTMANSSAIDSLTSTVQTQGDAISSVGGRTTSLENSLKTTNDNVSKKADSTTVQTLQNTVTQQGKDISAAGTNITSMQASLTRRTVFTVTAKGNGNSVTPGVFDESGKNLFTPGRSWALVTFAKQSDGSTVIATSKTYDVFGSANNGATMSADIEALASGTYVCVLTFDEPSGNRGKILSALESLGGTSEVVNSLPYRGAYILLGRKGMKPGDGLELRAPTGGDGTAHISTSVEFVNGVMMGLGAAGGVMMKADANASAITTLQNTVTQQGKDITSSSSAITSLQNGLVAANSNIDKKADATALQSLQNTVTQQGKDISTQSGNVTNLQNSLSATNTGLANLVADSDASKKIIGNLLTNPSFERGMEGYGGGASFMTVIDAQSPNSGSKILSCGAGSGSVSQSIVVTKDRTYKIGVFARCQSGTVVDNQSNNKLRIGNSSLLADFMLKPADLPTGSTWKEISGTWKATVSGSVDVSINSSLKSGNQYFDDFYFIDITDIVNIDAASNAVASLTSRVTSAEGTVSSHTGSITNLSNSLNSLNNTVSGKADATALSSLQNTVTQQGKDISSASGSITSLQSSLNTLKVQTNPWIDGTFETYDNNQQLGGSTAIVTTDFKSSGNKCLKVTRPANTSGNSDKTIGPYSAVRQSAKYRVEFWAMMPASEAPPSGWSVVVGLHSINKDGGNDWQGVMFNEGSLGARDQWVKFTGVVKVSPSVTRSHVWISTRGQSGSNTPGYAVYIDDFVITDITDAADAQATADANATAISSLQTKVSDIDGKVTAQTSQLSSMQSSVDASSSKVDQMSKTLSDSQSTQASLNTSLQSQIDAQASANIKNQADLNSATTSIASIKSTQATQATQISAMVKTQTDMTASLNSQSASIQTLQEAVSNNDALNSTWMVKMQTNNNGQKYAAGIALGVDGKNMQSQFLVQADRFALINTSNGNTTTPFVIDNGVTYMNAAFIKDGSIGSAKVGDLMSSNFQENVRGWRISRDGTMNINGSGPGSSRTVITNGRIEVYDSNNRLRVRMGIF
ncbi:phage tail tip fiber protein [Klebsiella pneumoniae]|nr:phage tail protein [Klebsiella pneumoniae]ROD90095.1 DUF1983 domain-containing protein [Klebsiella pneumoniae subsp. pneumoniae]SWU14524.1 putative phage tail protein [Klebsiella pneumoniae]HBB6759270.1 DUF1983 domain-containing protein [Citrobacter amalonaticus]HBX3561492.1 DUF1983 domain-containing protein [Klebsiella pneumoniae subsp. pneumoniae]